MKPDTPNERARRSLRHVAGQVRHPKRMGVIANKGWRRLTDNAGQLTSSENMRWLTENAVHFEDLARDLDAELWKESEQFSTELEAYGSRVVNALGVDLGGGGYSSCLYFLARRRKPEWVVETGVAAGFSSAALLAALTRNNHGQLWSSDFPYFRLKNPEQYIGVVVEQKLRERWHLVLEGDRINLPRILREVSSIDLIHYDSDKSYKGRRDTMSLLEKDLSPSGLIVMDDIQDNSYFHDWARQRREPWHVFFWHDKFVGISGCI